MAFLCKGTGFKTNLVPFRSKTKNLETIETIYIPNLVRRWGPIFAPIRTLRVPMDSLEHSGGFKTSLMPKRALERNLLLNIFSSSPVFVT